MLLTVYDVMDLIQFLGITMPNVKCEITEACSIPYIP
jgi:hypothetical protein